MMLRAKCENPPLKFSYPVEDYIPVVGIDSVSYWNKHCALCNLNSNQAVNIHLMSAPSGNSEFCFPENLNIEKILYFKANKCLELALNMFQNIKRAN